MKLSNRLLFVLVALLGVCVALAATNPTTTQYGRFLETQVTAALQRMDLSEGSSQQQIMRQILTSQGRKTIESLIRSNTERRNFGLFSIFTTRVFQVEVVVVGVGAHFIPLERQEELIKKLGRLML